MKILNLIEVYENQIISLQSFIINDLDDPTIQLVENMFRSKLIEKCNPDSLESYVEDGVFYYRDGSISLVWS